ncbi:ARM repeat-containing protein [Irpex rosettiformis]|uniref:ARM repeat-containing protein n=1 Tax=Irpex rosettiformis TaxID=378272 RepID=A0ACB8UFY0_9APHY|nr:ARM repeat-containing protein [Irpex rosettiformis]
MDYLRTLGSAAVSTLVQKSGLNLPFSLGAKVTSFEGKTIWSLYDGTKRDDGSQVSIFEFDANLPGKRNWLPFAKNAARKLRVTRHPDVLKFLDSVETDTTIYIMTERVRPLSAAMQDWSSKSEKAKEDWLLWGLHRLSVALSFVNDPCASTHGNLRIDSIFISPSGEWKLGGFELLSNPKDEAAVLYTLGTLLPETSMIASPEVKKSGYSVLKEQNVAAADGYALGLLIHAVFNPSHPLPATASPPHPPPNASSRGSIPLPVFPAFKRLLNPNGKARLTPKGFLEFGMAQTAGDGSGFFANNSLVKVCAGLDSFNISSESEKTALLRTLKESAASFPVEFASHRVLPALASALEFGGASAAIILPLLLQLGQNVSPQDYSSVILVHLVKLYASPDRGTRMALLDHLSEYADKLDKKIVSDKIWPNLQTGFSDTVPVIREATVKSITLLADKFNDRILNNDLLRYLAKMQADPEASIRTNTCILIGRIGPNLGYNTKRKVLVPAFTRALKDPFVHCRVAGLMSLMATIDSFEVEELATKVIPNMAFTLVDKEKLVRDQGFKAVTLFVKKLEEHAATLPETANPEGENPILASLSPPTPGQSTLVNSAAGAAGALAGWAISSIGKKLTTSDLQSTMSSVSQAASSDMDRPTSAPADIVSNNLGRPQVHPSLGATLSTPGVKPQSGLNGSTSKAKGMQLGASKTPVTSHLTADWAEEAAAEADAEESSHANPWGNDDLMDVNADQDDWSAYSFVLWLEWPLILL